MKRKLLAGLAIGFSLSGMTGVPSAQALDYDFNGIFALDNDILCIAFNVGSQSDVTVFSSSWYTGGFDPTLVIWDGLGKKMFEHDDSNIDSGSAVSNGISYAYGVYDLYLTVNLLPGNHIATISQYNNYAMGEYIHDGFTWDSDPQFTFTQGFGAEPYFNGVLSYVDARTGNWAVHLLNVDQAIVTSLDSHKPVPEPATMLLLGAGLAGLAGARLRKKKQ